jgi:tetratricopeptide (TPR) repeat protein
MVGPPTTEVLLDIPSLGRYQIRGRIGRGTMGIVYRGYDPVLAREIALKCVDLSPAIGASERAAFLDRFFQEARIAAKLLHPNIVITHDAATDETTSIPFIAMELVPGGSLSDRLESAGRLAWEEASLLVVLLARALDYAHRAGVVHRDVKPANVLLTADGVPKIADFGIAKIADAHLTQTGAVVGTPYYMSPEQLEADEVDGRSDLFSLGSLFYAALVGRPPFLGPDLASITRQVLHKNPEPPSEVVSGIARDLDGIVARALAKEPKDRYATGVELAEDLERAIRGEAPFRPLALGEKTIQSAKPAPEPALAGPGLERPRSSPWGVLFPLLLAGLGGYGAVAYWDDAEEIVRENREETKRREELASRAAGRLSDAREEMARDSWDEAHRSIEESLALSREARNGAGEAGALLLRGLLRAETGEWSEARADLESAASVFEIYGVREGRSKALLERASLERDLGSFDRARALYDSAGGPEAVLGSALLDLMREDYEGAERGLRLLYESGEEEEVRSRGALYLGILAFARGDADEAEKLWIEARDGCDSHEIDLFRRYAALAAGRVEESRTLFESSARHFERIGRPSALTSAREGLAGRTDEGPLRTIFLGEPRTKRSDERRERLPAVTSPPRS